MIIKYCPKCYGRPYTLDNLQEKCPRCKAKLQLESVEDEDLEGRECLTDIDTADELFHSSYESGYHNGSDATAEDANEHSADIRETVCTPRNSGFMRGRVSNYSCTQSEGAAYHRNGMLKLWQLLVLKQSTEDVLHRFTLWAQSDGEQIPITVNIHGSLASGAAIHDNTEIIAEGKMYRDVFYAKKMSVVHNLTTSPINIRTNFADIIVAVLAIITVLLTVFFAFSYGFSTVFEWLKVTIIIFTILTIAYFLLSVTKLGIILRLTRKSDRGFPYKAIFLISTIISAFAITGMIRNLGYAAGASLSALFSSLRPVLTTCLVLAVVIYLVYRIVKP